MSYSVNSLRGAYVRSYREDYFGVIRGILRDEFPT